MTVASQSAPLAVHDVEQAMAALRAGGHRVSAPMRRVLRILFDLDEPVSAEAIAAGMSGQFEPLDLASVYRNLERLEEVGAVRHVHLGHGAGLYTLNKGTEREYLVCQGCGAVKTIDADALDQVRGTIHAKHGFSPDFSHFPLHGWCDRCGRVCQRARELREGQRVGGRESRFRYLTLRWAES